MSSSVQDLRDKIGTLKVIRHRGTPQKATTLREEKVERVAGFFISELGHAYIPATPYDNHFVYESKKVGQSSYMCTCGSPAVIVSGFMVCLHHRTYGVHQGDSKWI
jgi:hypothetical protein